MVLYQFEYYLKFFKKISPNIKIINHFKTKIMNKVKSVGIWLDHSSAHVMEYNSGNIETNIIEAKNSQADNDHNINKSENLLHNREQNVLTHYYKKISEVIKNYDEVLLFGPTNAKAELNNILKDDHHFEKIKIEVQSSDKMTENQLHAYVKNHFSKN